MSSETMLAADLSSAVRDSNSRKLSEAIQAIDRFVFDLNQFPNGLFTETMVVLHSSELHKLDSSIAIVKLFEYQLDLLSDSQREELANELVGSIPKFADELAAFLAVELLVDLWPGQPVLDSLKAMKAGASVNTLLSIIHGLDWLAKRSVDPSIKAACVSQLSELATHKDFAVVREAKEALKRRSA